MVRRRKTDKKTADSQVQAVPGSASWNTRKQAARGVVEPVQDGGDDYWAAEANTLEAYEKGGGTLVRLPPFYDEAIIPSHIHAVPILEGYLRFPVEAHKTYLCASLPQHCRILWHWSIEQGHEQVWVDLPDTAHPHYPAAHLGARKLYNKMWEWMKEQSR